MTFTRDLAAAQAAREQQHDEEYLQFSTGEMFDFTIDGSDILKAAEQLAQTWEFGDVPLEAIARILSRKLEENVLEQLRDPVYAFKEDWNLKNQIIELKATAAEAETPAA